MASGLSMPVGFKNSTDGNVINAINGIRAAAGNHEFLGVDGDGFLSTVKTRGNPHTHIVLRGGKKPNYDTESIAGVIAQLEQAGLPKKVLIDGSHENSGKDHVRQKEVIEDIIEQLSRDHTRRIMGIMIESHLHGGNQKFEPGMTSRESLQY
jgi:3-deoxy-7-phosphoheptulonate synthase